ncbi:cation:proton antiporter regulatory subunit [Bacillus altitudinis]|uniref:cation:proton antiporter regulatory subunit n=1 Tax=Bacillus altitudinis TaxID=293387 RepID=UPI0012DC33F3|nr:cation:proton antiporter regulatory subunit [Bacillus altitudinis]MCY7496653.1 cation:proton antiporter regulatory subunit [Bacillus altitudinis]MCY7535907.1 cation:proton antiporter regulatory subunit [Bacillus altitudinis]MCY7548430.1 cation:proton antiporter regulatory subunit [Bacillus altitudinis]MCY7554679.1 cation:proton antiporter regulatory subunit [Bacillus altitudinis]MCY7591135.1 cation:proton antiporter regulatory subunit [Bacillus altitudinis]
MKVRETELPGIGHKVEMITRNNEKLAIITHDDGRREMYHFQEDDHEECISGILLSDEEARQISAILGGMVYKPKALETVEVAIDELIIEWFKIEKNAPAVNQTIGDLSVRQNYQVTVIAIVRKSHEKILNPGPDTVIEEGDTLVISGERKELKSLIKEKLSS